MKLLRIVADGLPLFRGKLDICLYARQRVSQDQRDSLYPLLPAVFLNTTNVFAGINASGKTSTMKVILFVLNLLSGKPVNAASGREILGRAGSVAFQTVFYSEKTDEICKLETVVSFSNTDHEGQPVYIIAAEKLWCRKAGGVTARRRLLDFGQSGPALVRGDPETCVPQPTK